MTKWQLTRPDGPWDFPAVGVRAVSGAILDGDAHTPAITDPPDPSWVVYTGGSAETGITMIAPYGNPGTVVPTGSKVPIYRGGGIVFLSTADFAADPDVSAAFSATFGPEGTGGNIGPTHQFAGSGALGGTLLKTVSDIINGEPISALRSIPRSQHAAILDGTSTYDATTAVQSLLTDMDHGQMTFPRGKFVHGNLQVQDKHDFKLVGHGSTHYLTGTASAQGLNGIGFQMVGTVTNFEASGLHIIGDGVVANAHKGFWNDSGQTLALINWHDMHVEQTTVGFSINANTSGSVDQFFWDRLVARDIQGIGSGQGYGFHLAYVNASSTRAQIGTITAVRCKRHGLYVARAQDYEIGSVIILGHRSTLTSGEQADATDGRGKLRAGINIARSKHGRIAKVTYIDGYDGAIGLVPDPESTGTVDMYDISIEEMILRNPQNGVPLVSIGDQNPGVAGIPSAITLEDTKVYADWSLLSGVSSVPAIQINSGKNISVRGVTGTMLGVNQNTAMVSVQARSETAGTATYNDDILVDGVVAHMETTSGSACRAVRLETAACAAAARVIVRGTETTGAAADTPVYLAANPTNPNLLVFNRAGECVGLYAAGTTTPSVGRGVTQLDIANASATSITGLSNPQEGQLVTLQFYDAKTTLVYSSTFQLANKADLVSSAGRIIKMRYHQGTWYEEGRVTKVGDVLARTSYAPASRSTKTVTGDTALHAVDTVNATVAFVAPPSGKVTVRLNGPISISATGLASWGLLDHTTTAQVGGTSAVTSATATSLPVVELEISGLTAGTTYQYDWAFAVSVGTITATMQIGLQSGSPATAQTAAPAVMTVLAA